MKNIDEEMNSSSQSDFENQKFEGNKQNLANEFFNQNVDTRFKENVNDE